MFHDPGQDRGRERESETRRRGRGARHMEREKKVRKGGKGKESMNECLTNTEAGNPWAWMEEEEELGYKGRDRCSAATVRKLHK